jgi:predicted HTH transcriptional regulator
MIYNFFIEKWGTGIPRIFRECKEYGLPNPNLIELVLLLGGHLWARYYF